MGFDNIRFGSALLALVLCLAAPARSAGVVSDELMVSGAVKNKLTLKVDDLKAFAPDQIVSVTVMRRVESMRPESAAASKPEASRSADASRNADASKEAEVPSIARGVRLTAILERAGLANTDPNDWKHTVVLATATDNYRVVFSWPELFNSDLGASVLVVFERDGQPLTDRDGHIALVSAKDQRTGPRSVRWLRQLDIKVLRE